MTTQAGTASPWRAPLGAWLQEHAASLSLDAERVEMRELVNPSGWHENVACLVLGGASRLHVKLTRHGDGLRQTYRLRERLASRYRMPPILAWIELDGFVGIVKPSVPAKLGGHGVIPALLPVINRLHGDRELLDALSTPAKTMREAFADLWIERLTEDLDELQAEDRMPPFVTREMAGWMREETVRLEAMTRTASFDLPADSPVHQDLHLGNVLVEPDGTWWLIDWDDLSRGDPAADMATLLAPLLERGKRPEELLGERPASFMERFALSSRAVVLDIIVDSLADWADAGQSPESANSVRRDKRAAHESALRAYGIRYTD